MLTVAVLGPVEARRDGVRLEVPAGKTTELLVRLTLDAGAPVRTDVLLEDLWAEPTARNTLQSKVSQLRRVLGREVVVASGDGYALALPPEAVDVAQVRGLAATSAAARAAGDPATALRCATEALSRFRGEILVEAGDWAAPHRARLEDVRLTLLEHAVAARLDLGAGGEMAAELEALVAAYPLREGLWAALITVLYRAGRQADALATYARVRRMLVDELGVEPGPALRALEGQVLQQSPDLGAPPPAALAAAGNLTPVPSATIGRDDDIAAVTAALDRHRLVTVLGTGGVGKTRLALEVAGRLRAPGGVWLIRLDAVAADTVLWPLLAATLHVSIEEAAVHERLSGAETVLVLDNCEHLIGPAAALVEGLLASAPRLRVLATSQAPLGLPEEHPYALAPLDPEASSALFVLRAAEARPRLVLDADSQALVGQVCGALDGLPLAIELAAARVRSLSVADIARRLEDRFTLLRDPSSPRPERRRALAGAIAWSYELLFPDDQRGLWALSCFSGSASLAATEHVLAALEVPAEAVLDTIGRLVDRSLVNVDDVGGGTLRYRLLDSIRSYAADRLRESGLADVTAAAHAAWYAETAAWCDAHIHGTRQADCVAVGRAERGNVDAALAWCATHDRELGGRIAVGFGWTWVVLGDGTAGAARIRTALTDDLPPADRARGRLTAGWLEASAGDVGLAQADLDQARDLARDLADPMLAADVDRHQAFVAIQQGRPDLVRTAADASLAFSRPRGLAWRTASAQLLGAYGSLMSGDTVTAARDAAESVRLIGALGDSWGLVHGQALLGTIAQAEHRFGDAAAALEQAAEESAVLGFRGQAALHRATLARVQQRAGDPAAVTSFQRAITDALAVGDGRLAATARLNFARWWRAAGDAATAIALLVENERWYAAAGGGDFALLNRGVLAAARDDVEGLAAVRQQAVAAGQVEIEVGVLDALARLAVAAGDHATGRRLLARADDLMPQVAHLLDDGDRVDAHQVRAALADGAGT